MMNQPPETACMYVPHSKTAHRSPSQEALAYSHIENKKRPLFKKEWNIRLKTPHSEKRPGSTGSGYFVVLLSVEDQKNTTIMTKHPILVKHNTTVYSFLQQIYDTGKKMGFANYVFWEGLNDTTKGLGAVFLINQGS